MHSLSSLTRRFSFFYLGSLMIFLSLSTPLLADKPVFEATFNTHGSDFDFQNGAAIGPDGSGVSGKPEDKAYTASVATLAPGGKGPAAEFKQDYSSVTGADELTITAWYKPANAPLTNATLFEAVGALLIFDHKASWTLRLGAISTGDNKKTWFVTGDNPPQGLWARPGEWTFFSAVWKRADKTVTFYQGSTTRSVVVAQVGTRVEEESSLDESPANLRTIGNSRGPAKDRPFDGSIDDVRFYTKALDRAAIEQIRQADLKNEPVP